MPPSPSDYDIPRPSKIKLKTTKAEKADKIYRREQRRTERERRRIARANAGYASPERTRPESVSPPRYGPRAGAAFDYEEDEPPHHHLHDDWNEKLAWMAQEELGNPFASFDMPRVFPGQRVPSRHQHHDRHAGPSRRNPADEVRERGGPAPYMGAMNDDEYAEFVREGMRRRRHKQDMDELETRRRAKREADRRREIQEELEREREAKREEKRDRRANKERREAEELDAKALETSKVSQRSSWRRRCAALMDGDIVSTQLTFNDIPWPLYKVGADDFEVLLSLDDITIERVRVFLYALADDEAKAPKDAKALEDARRKLLRDAIFLFHPDRFGRVLSRVVKAERATVKEGGERASRVINDLKSTI